MSSRNISSKNCNSSAAGSSPFVMASLSRSSSDLIRSLTRINKLKAKYFNVEYYNCPADRRGCCRFVCFDLFVIQRKNINDDELIEKFESFCKYFTNVFEKSLIHKCFCKNKAPNVISAANRAVAAATAALNSANLAGNFANSANSSAFSAYVSAVASNSYTAAASSAITSFNSAWQ